jgi:hypothetical protein
MPDGWAASAGGFPTMTSNIRFLMKDIVLLQPKPACRVRVRHSPLHRGAPGPHGDDRRAARMARPDRRIPVGPRRCRHMVERGRARTAPATASAWLACPRGLAVAVCGERGSGIDRALSPIVARGNASICSGHDYSSAYAGATRSPVLHPMAPPPKGSLSIIVCYPLFYTSTVFASS